jgi:hypothetical protein
LISVFRLAGLPEVNISPVRVSADKDDVKLHTVNAAKADVLHIDWAL